MGKIKIFNDPVYGFVSIQTDLVFKIIEHPYFQRLRRIKQLGLSELVYPGAHHSRFHHTLGALYLMDQAIHNLKIKGVDISDEEAEGACLAILLHDIGHGPFSHALESAFTTDLSHEQISLAYMDFFNKLFVGRLDIAISIFKGSYHKRFLCQLVSGQLDIDRLDYLRRDSFYTGVSEGIIGSDRIIKMMNVVDNELVVDEKGIYSIEKFLLARNLMYWQVYLHKTVIGAEVLMMKIVERVRLLISSSKLTIDHAELDYFLSKSVGKNDFELSPKVLEYFSALDDIDLMYFFKKWMNDSDSILSSLCKMLVNRNLLKVKLQNQPFTKEELSKWKEEVQSEFALSDESLPYMFFTGTVKNVIYANKTDKIRLLMKNGLVEDFENVSIQYDLNVLSKQVQKYYICHPKKLIL